MSDSDDYRKKDWIGSYSAASGVESCRSEDMGFHCSMLRGHRGIHRATTLDWKDVVHEWGPTVGDCPKCGCERGTENGTCYTRGCGYVSE